MGQYVLGYVTLVYWPWRHQKGCRQEAGCNVLSFKRRVDPDQELELASCVDGVTSDLSEVLSQSDYLANVLPRRRPVFINVERGDVVAEETIISALDNGIWSRAVPGVYEKEPLPPQSGLIFVANFNCYLRGGTMTYKLDWATGY
ncbi:D-isomer specific 2-hydroxyacid dehydrogenase, putative [Phytophthora infestans T30-4]|uniref:D-isomer specific 2-hydroxyacid dehydrogenase, putative n=1 Tax=Phytophthora infestans (strain T30-4) TaxID=403677 RepID=D0N4V9_PHYIT|nr:D-isomer specific 2-hydroxyacid dehydrogenase, putative [Phytophthora infestans T30-4]EEY69917.1 D-isomer specific 2-hydroxyacid dehydrogenase, putative [Phytophthora infestans T30-4]|eukprot:XP_002998564.1 D-isomer specific 2-hydroxyacid dehydrogenase, putative [Phytophthora infestans T30-4]